MATKKVVKKWFHPRIHTGWDKHMTAIGRRRKAIIGHKGNYLSAGRSLQALSNTTTDPATKRLSALDARYFFRKHQETGK